LIEKAMLELIYEAASIQRWNDHVRPGSGFTELDKQAHKIVFAYVIGKFEEADRRTHINWKGLVEGGIFEFFHRVVLTDIKPAVFHRLMEEKGRQLNRWVLDKVEGTIRGIEGGFSGNFERYLFDPDYGLLEKRILRAAHYLATKWEFGIIYRLNEGIYGLDETRTGITNEIEDHMDLAGVQKIEMGKKTRNFLDLVGQLRFQKRWAQSPRIPETSVMGHMLVVAILSYLCSLEIDACDQRIVNNFFAGLYHDLPEVLTRDIVSPVKKSIAGLEELIKEIENRQVEERLFPLIPSAWRGEIRYFTEDEFSSKVILDDGVHIVSSADIGRMYNMDCYHPLDGELIRACDHLAAFLEASLSIEYGIKTRHLEDGRRSFSEAYRTKTVAGIDFGRLFGYYDRS
jgi:putative hydrolase of HD superfamily